MKIIGYFCIFLLYLSVGLTVSAQSISGNMNAGSNLALGFGNVTIFQGEKKIASILTDEMGNFNIKLDTGYYRLEFEYAGYEKMIKEIHVTGDEKGDFGLNKDRDYAPIVSERVGETRISSKYTEGEISYDMHDPHRRGSVKRSSGVGSSVVNYYRGRGAKVDGKSLTAGELNDFSKWELWKDITSNDLSAHQSYWEIFLSERYSFQLVNEQGYPVQGALIELLNEKDSVLFSSLTDNTGKAELWGNLTLQTNSSKRVQAKVYVEGRTYIFKHLSTFENGINSLTVTADCRTSEMVDIAFVVDATGSMGDEIEYLKNELNQIVYQTKNNLTNLTFNYASVFYRDHGDIYLTRRADFTDVLSETVNFISDQSASSGGDYEEAVEVALNEAIDSLSWSEGARTRILFLVLDAPPHNTPEIQEELKEIIKKSAQRGIRIVPLVASGINRDGEYLMRTLALGTNGTYIYLTNDSGVGNYHLSPITNEHKVESLNEILIRIIETYTYFPNCEQEDSTSVVDKYLDDNSLDNIEIEIWPNPTSKKAYLKINQTVTEVYLMDLTGKIIYRIEEINKNREETLDLSSFPKGIYQITFVYKDETYARKIIKI